MEEGVATPSNRTGGGNGNPLQHSCLENPMARGAWQAIVHGAARVRDSRGLNHHAEAKDQHS